VQPPEGDNLVVPTPELVAFQYGVAGIGSRFLAQLVDGAVFGVAYFVIVIAASVTGGVTGSPQLAGLIGIVLAFLVTFGYFIVWEAVWNGQTPGKRAMRLRVVGDRGEPIGFAQSAIRNLVRIVDFLPVAYGIGVIVLFINGRGKRLGDLAAGTVVVRERERIALHDLASASPAAPAASPEEQQQRDRLARLEPGLRRLISGYAARREELPVARREALAQSAAPALRRAVPDLVDQYGPLGALDRLAEIEGITPLRPMVRKASAALTLGVIALVMPVFSILAPIGVICGVLAIVFATQAMHRVRDNPGRLRGADRARTARVLAIIGLAIDSLITAFFAFAFFASR
jgi:uncharacterized RDD family membrane protein YckC